MNHFEMALIERCIQKLFPSGPSFQSQLNYNNLNFNTKKYRCKAIELKKNSFIDAITLTSGNIQIIYLLKYLVLNELVNSGLSSYLIDCEDQSPAIKNIPATHLEEEFRQRLVYFKNCKAIACSNKDCRSTNTVYKSIQTRSCDEEARLLIICNDCNKVFEPKGPLRFVNSAN